MKKVWVSMLIMFLMFSLISCSNGKNGTSKEIQTINDKQQVEQKFEVEPYPWVSRKPILKNTELSNTEGSWQYESERYKKLKEEGKEELEDGHKLGERLMLFIRVLIMNTDNLKIGRGFEPRPEPSKIKLMYFTGSGKMFFNPTKIKPHKKEIIYNEKNIVRNEVNIVLIFFDGSSEFDSNFKMNALVRNTKDYKTFFNKEQSFYDINTIKSTWGSTVRTFQNIPSKISEESFPSNHSIVQIPYYFYPRNDFEITKVDINGNIRGRYGEEEFLISPGESWQSKINKQELSRDLFVYDWPYKKNGEWKKDKIEKIFICGEKDHGDGRISFSKENKLVTNDRYLVEIAKKEESYNEKEFKEILKYIKQKYPDLKLNFNIKDWDKISIYLRKHKNFKMILPKNGNVLFVSQIKIDNFGWRIYYY